MERALLAILAILLLFSVWLNQKFYFSNEKLKTNLSRTQQELKRVQGNLSSLEAESAARFQSVQEQLASVDQQLQQKTALLQNLRSQYGGTNDVDLGGNNINNMEWDVKHQKDLIASLDRQSKDLQDQISSYSQAGQQDQNQNRAYKAQKDAEFQNQIQTQEYNLTQIRNQLALAKQEHQDLNVIQNINQQVNNQIEFIKSLRSQKLNFDRESQGHSNLTRQQAEAAKQNLLTQKIEVQNHAKQEREILKSIQGRLDEAKKTAQNHSSQVKDLRNQIASIQKEIQDLQEKKKQLQTQSK